MSAIGFGDTVRIRTTVETESLGLAGRTGLVYGFTTPSDTGVQVVGSVAKDIALSVKIDGKDEPLWLDPDLVEFVDHTPGATVRIGHRSCMRGADGEWNEDTRTNEV
jgi:hypothetical protein